jgi:hypothetical protein
MAHVEAPNGIVLYWYKASPYGRRVAWYLALRNIAYAQCVRRSCGKPHHSQHPDPAATMNDLRRNHTLTPDSFNHPTCPDPTLTP